MGEDFFVYLFGFVVDFLVLVYYLSLLIFNIIGVFGDGLIVCRYYVLECGIYLGVYVFWIVCEVEVKGFRGVKFKVF